MSDDKNPIQGLQVAARNIPIPQHLSPGAQGFLAAWSQREKSNYPALDDIEGWKKHITAGDEMLLALFTQEALTDACEVREVDVGHTVAFDIIPPGVSADDRRVYYYIHGGALIMGGGEACKQMGAASARTVGARVQTVDYRMPPDYPYPAGLDDCVEGYRRLLRDHTPDDIIFGGASAGGNLVAATIFRARDEGLPLPAAAVLLSPELDLTESGDSFATNAGIDAMGSLMAANLLYAGSEELSHPYVSPLLGDVARGFPPSFITAGTRDLFLSNAVRFHRALRRAGIDAELHITEAAPHGAFMSSVPEGAEIDQEFRLFCEKHWQRKKSR